MADRARGRSRTKGAGPTIPARDTSRGDLLRGAFDALARLNTRRLPWRVVATDVWTQHDENDRLRIDIVAQYGRRPWYLAVFLAPGSGSWAFVRHPVIQQPGSRAVYLDNYELKDDEIVALPNRLTHASNVFRLALDESRSIEAGMVATSDPMRLAQDALRGQDGLARAWLAGRLSRMTGQPGARGTLVSVVVAGHSLRRVSWLGPTAAESPVAAVGLDNPTSMEWLWLECGCPRNLRYICPEETRLPLDFDPDLTRHVSVSRVAGLESLLTSDEWPGDY